MMIGMILIIPRPQILQMMITTMATSAMPQLVSQLSTADFDRFSPMAMMIGPVTIGGKYRMTRFAPKALKSAASTRYISPATATPKQA